MTSKKLAGVSLLALFILGFVLGFAVDRFALGEGSRRRHSRPSDQKIIDNFTRDLALTKAQRDSLVVLLEGLKKRHGELRESISVEFDRIRDDFKNGFSAILTEEQKVKFAEIEKKLEHKKK